MLAQVLGCSQIDSTPAKELGKAGFNSSEADETGLLPGCKLHKKIDVAVRPSGPFENRTEQGEAANVVPSAEVSQCVVIKR